VRLGRRNVGLVELDGGARESGIGVATLATLLIIPAVFTVIQGGATRHSPSLYPFDPDGRYFTKPDDLPDAGNGVVLHDSPSGDVTCAQATP